MLGLFFSNLNAQCEIVCIAVYQTCDSFVLSDLWFYVPVYNYGHVETVNYPNHTVPGQASLAVKQY